MPSPIISVENLGKSYLVGHQSAQEQRYTALRDVFSRTIKRFGRNVIDMARGRQIVQGDDAEEFWALKDVSFEVKEGEVLGIIGRNGAGKSTLLKILSRVTEPTKGRVKLKGRVASLLEVGTGFHPELTGRENVFLNGAILGMTRIEIRRKFDEIIDFAGVEKFLDTPVKRYSSGMYVRLAFSVAAHLEPEILVVDEVLAVGDLEFQKKCLGKMHDVSTTGRTVLFVSHNMAAVNNLCETGVFLESATVRYSGSIEKVVGKYLNTSVDVKDAVFEPNKLKPSITAVRIDQSSLLQGDIRVEVQFESPFPLKPPVVGMVITSSGGGPVFGSNPRFHSDGFNPVECCNGIAHFAAAQIPLASGRYLISVWLGDCAADYDEKLDVLGFEFMPEKSHAKRPPSAQIGYLDWIGEWRIQ